MKKQIIPSSYVELNDLDKIQAVLKHILRRFHDICKENNLTYNIFGGTMLGAVRHGDIIPWDDDIDVTMPFEDYDKLFKILENDSELLLRKIGDKGYAYPFAKLCLKQTILVEELASRFSFIGAYIDIFPVGEYPIIGEDAFFTKLKKLKKKRAMIVCKIKPSKTWWKKIFYPFRLIQINLQRVFCIKKIEKKEENMLRKCHIEGNEYLLLHGTGWGKRGKLLKTTYFDRTLYNFGNQKVYGIRNFKSHLESLYGDYMEMPPLQKRIPKHNYKLFIDKEKLKDIIFNEIHTNL